jgi:hypothetical protein
MAPSSGMSRRRLLGSAAAGAAAAGAGLLLPATAWARPRPAALPPIDVQWSTDFSGGWDGWLDTPWNDLPQGAVKRPTVVASPTGTGSAARFHLDGGQERNESQPTAAQDINPGDSLFVGFTDYLEDGFPVGTSDWQVVLQFKNDSTGSPPIEIKVGDGQYYLDGNSGAWRYDIGPAVTGRAIDVTVRVAFSTDPAQSWIDAWYNGTQTVTAAQPKGSGTLYSGQSSYLKAGIYRDTGISQAGTRYLLGMSVGTPA